MDTGVNSLVEAATGTLSVLQWGHTFIAHTFSLLVNTYGTDTNTRACVDGFGRCVTKYVRVGCNAKHVAFAGS